MVRNGKREANQTVRTKHIAPPKRKGGSLQGAKLETTEAPEERDDERPSQQTRTEDAPRPETSFLKNNQTRQLTICLVAFAVGIVGIALLVLRDNIAMLACGCIFLSLAGLAVLAMGVWRCYDARKYTSIGIGYSVARTTNADGAELGAEGGEPSSGTSTV